ncbi:MAG: carbohydrate-binding domain-containing protein, partial [Paracraurococcus sp.]
LTRTDGSHKAAYDVFKNGAVAAQGEVVDTVVSDAVSTTLGSGSDALVLKISQEAYQGSAQYTIAVDGKQIGDTQTASALYGSGGDTITLLGDFGADAHTVTVTFLNDAWGGTSDKDRNLHVDGITLNDTDVEGAVATLGTTGSKSFTVKGASTV